MSCTIPTTGTSYFEKKNFVIKINNYNRYSTPRGASIDTIRAMNIVLLDHRTRP